MKIITRGGIVSWPNLKGSLEGKQNEGLGEKFGILQRWRS